MKTYTQKDLISALKKIGLVRSDIVYIHSRLFSLGNMKEGTTKDKLCRKILDAFFKVISENGTIVVPTFTTQTQRYGVPFVLEETESMTGMFSEYIRCHPESIRSLHPINSVAAIGKHKEIICNDISASNYGLDSPFDRMLSIGAKSVSLGLDYFSNSWCHYLEAVYGLPYIYNKLLNVEVYKDGKIVNKPFFAAIRYLDFKVENNFKYFDRIILEKNLIKTVKLAGGIISCISANEYTCVGLELLKENPYAFLASPPSFQYGEKPFDGITEGRDDQSGQRAFAFLAKNEKKK